MYVQYQYQYDNFLSLYKHVSKLVKLYKYMQFIVSITPQIIVLKIALLLKQTCFLCATNCNSEQKKKKKEVHLKLNIS